MITLQKSADRVLGIAMVMLALSLCMTTWIFIKLATTDIITKHSDGQSSGPAIGAIQVMDSAVLPTTETASFRSNATLVSAVTAASVDEATRKCQQLKCSNTNQYSYWVRSGYRTTEGPTICFNGQLVVSPNRPDTFSRGVNIVVIHDKLKTVMDYRSFDTYISPDACLDLAQYLSINVPFKGLVLLASFDDMAYCLCDNAKKVLTEFGSKLITDVKFRSNWVLVGQSGLLSGLAIEKLVNKDSNEFAERTEVEGCANVPFTTAYVPVSVDIGLEHAKCGVPNCGFDELALHIFTGQQSASKPKICIAGHHVVWPGVKGGRGFNMVVVDPLSKNVIAVRHFDSYTTESSNIDLFLETVSTEHILVGVVHDEATLSLHSFTKQLFEEFGVYMVKELKTRSIMYFVGKRGLFNSPYQEVSHAASSRHWPVPIDKRLCLPAEFNLKPESEPATNVNRSKFCYLHSGYRDFCFVHHKNEPIKAKPSMAHLSAKGISNVPILVIAGLNSYAVLETLQSLIAVPGLIPSQVLVAYLNLLDELSDLTKLFGFKSFPVGNVDAYSTHLGKAMETVWSLYPDADYIILIDEETVVAETFLDYMDHALVAMGDNEMIGAASAWNPLGFSRFALDPNAVYYVEDFVGMAVLLSKKFYSQQMMGRLATCCSRRSWSGWFTSLSLDSQRQQFVFLIPEVPRADYYREGPYHLGAAEGAIFLDRKKLLGGLGPVDLRILPLPEYEDALIYSLRNGINMKELLHDICGRNMDIRSDPADRRIITRKARLLVFKSNSTNNYTVLHKLLGCFGFSVSDNVRMPGIFRGLLRLSLNGRPTYLLSSASPYMHFLLSSRKVGTLGVVELADI